MTDTTWDGLPVSDTDPRGASVIVYRDGQCGLEVLVLHRAHHGPDYEGDWAWTPPSGARQPGEYIDLVARRELEEETGLRVDPERTSHGDQHWFVYKFEYKKNDPIVLDEEHDKYEWVGIREAIKRCLPDSVSTQLVAFHKAETQNL